METENISNNKTDIRELIVEKYNIPEEMSARLIAPEHSEVWLDRRELGITLKVKAKAIDRILSRLDLYDIKEKRVTRKAIAKDYVKFSVSKNGNVKEVFNIYTISSLLYARKLDKKEKRKSRKKKNKKYS